MAEVMVGPRYRVQDSAPGGGGTFKLEVCGSTADGHYRRYAPGELVEIPEPVAGPILRLRLPENGGRWYAACERCNGGSKAYKRKNEPAMWRWARAHRCGR